MARRAAPSANSLARTRALFGLDQTALALYLGLSLELIRSVETGRRRLTSEVFIAFLGAALAGPRSRPRAGARRFGTGFSAARVPALSHWLREGNGCHRTAGPRGPALGSRPARPAASGGRHRPRPRQPRPGNLADGLADTARPPTADGVHYALAPASGAAGRPHGRGGSPGREGHNAGRVSRIHFHYP
ncbi:hypothetical protein ACVWYF_003073 [Hymenobacter sp. UYAg731]